MKTEKDYRTLLAELMEIESCTGVYLVDECIDAENAGVSRDHPEFFSKCYSAACCAAGSRAEDHGMDINGLMGRVIY